MGLVGVFWQPIFVQVIFDSPSLCAQCQCILNFKSCIAIVPMTDPILTKTEIPKIGLHLCSFEFSSLWPPDSRVAVVACLISDLE